MWWVDRDGNNPEPFTLITLADVDSGKWLPVYEPEKSRECIANIEKYAKKTLCIWPYHCIKDTSGNDLEDQFASTLDSLRNVNKTIVVKGLTPYTEMYGIFKPEYDPDNEINIELLNSLRSYDKIFIAGEAADYCVYESVKQILEYYANEPEVTSKIYILEDCMSSISGKSVNEIFDELKNEYNLNIVKSTEYKL
jgi:nicotinamidase-related amidase